MIPALQEQVKASQSMAEASQLKATLNLFSMDTYTMDAMGREYLLLRKSVELAKLKKQLYEMGENFDEMDSNPVTPGGAEPCASTMHGQQPGQQLSCTARRTPLQMPFTPTNEANQSGGDTELIYSEEDY